MVTKILKKLLCIDLYGYSVRKRLYLKEILMKTDIFFLIKEENVFIKYMEILEKVNNIIKNKFNSKLMYSKKYLKAEKEIKINTKGVFQCLYAPIILIESIYSKDENYYSKVILEKYYFIEDIEFFCSNSDEEYYDEKCINLF